MAVQSRVYPIRIDRGWNTVVLDGLPHGTNVVSVWITNNPNDSYPGIEADTIHTIAVQLYDEGRRCRVRFTYDEATSSHLEGLAMVVFDTA